MDLRINLRWSVWERVPGHCWVQNVKWKSRMQCRKILCAIQRGPAFPSSMMTCPIVRCKGLSKDGIMALFSVCSGNKTSKSSSFLEIFSRQNDDKERKPLQQNWYSQYKLSASLFLIVFNYNASNSASTKY